MHIEYRYKSTYYTCVFTCVFRRLGLLTFPQYYIIVHALQHGCIVLTRELNEVNRST